jgi:hypothetical protein
MNGVRFAKGHKHVRHKKATKQTLHPIITNPERHMTEDGGGGKILFLRWGRCRNSGTELEKGRMWGRKARTVRRKRAKHGPVQYSTVQFDEAISRSAEVTTRAAATHRDMRKP